MSNKTIFDELNAAIRANEGNVPDRFTINGETFQRVGLQAQDGPVKKKWKNPKTQKETEELVESVTIAVAPYADRIVLDGIHYLANRTYEVPTAMACAIRDIVAQTWRHEAQTGGAYSYGSTSSVRNPAHLAGRAGVGFAQ